MGRRWTYGNQWSAGSAMLCHCLMERSWPDSEGKVIWTHRERGTTQLFYERIFFYFDSNCNRWASIDRGIMAKMLKSVTTIWIQPQHTHIWKPFTNILEMSTPTLSWWRKIAGEQIEIPNTKSMILVDFYVSTIWACFHRCWTRTVWKKRLTILRDNVDFYPKL